ncbi:MAG: hypothetical protein VX772_03905 [Bacteroidota bacterium]|nr:hypothetical protein [Bacteroidota bacterium]
MIAFTLWAFFGDIQMNTWDKITFGLWGACGGGIVLAIIGFAWFGWVTGGTAKETAERMAEKAVIDRLAPSCVKQFNQDPKKVQKLEKLKKTQVWHRGMYIEAQGWATVLGEKKPDNKVAEKCSEMILAANEK